MTFRVRRDPKKVMELPGMSTLRHDERGRLVEHLDYWDSAVELALFPVLGRVVRLVKKVMK